MKRVIICGKGGAGKTTLTSLITTMLVTEKPDAKILVIDADPAANLAISLGLVEKPQVSIGELDEMVPENRDERNETMLDTFTKECVVHAKLQSGFVDYAYLGHHVKNSCLCSYNNALNYILKFLNKDNQYDYIIIDREAGLEHINRSVYGNSDDALVLVSWPSEEYLGVVKDIIELADILGSTQKRLLVLNNVHGAVYTDDEINEALTSGGIEINDVITMPRLDVHMGLKKRNSSEILETADAQTKSAISLITKFIS